jgi:DNA-binding HxlR family transcriptional regulator
LFLFGVYFLIEIYLILGIVKCIAMRDLDLRYPTCPIRNILSRMSDKWSLLILRSLQKNGTMRYKELLAAIPDISQKMLSSTLKRLEEDHLINRKMYPEIPPRVEYKLTETAKDLMPALQMMIDWAQVHFEEIAGSVNSI